MPGICRSMCTCLFIIPSVSTTTAFRASFSAHARAALVSLVNAGARPRPDTKTPAVRVISGVVIGVT